MQAESAGENPNLAAAAQLYMEAMTWIDRACAGACGHTAPPTLRVCVCDMTPLRGCVLAANWPAHHKTKRSFYLLVG